MWLLQLKFGRVFNGDDTFAVINELAQGVQQRCLAGTSATRNENVEPSPPGDFQELSHGGSHRAVCDHTGHIETMARKLSNRDARAMDGQRRKDNVHPTAVGQST